MKEVQFYVNYDNIIKQVPYSLLTALLLSIDFSYAKNPIWKPGNENDRKFPIDRTLQSERNIPNDKKMQITAKKLNDKKIPIDRTLPNGRRMLIDRKLQNDKRIPIDRVLQNDRKNPIDRTLQNVRENPYSRPLQNERRIPIERTLQNGRRMPTDETLQNVGRIPIDKALQNNRLKQKDKKIKMETILEQDRKMHNDLKEKIDRLLQNENLQTDKILRGGRSMINGGIEKDLNEKNYRQILDERQKKIMLARRNGYDKRMLAGTPHPILRHRVVDDELAKSLAVSTKNLTLVPIRKYKFPQRQDLWVSQQWEGNIIY